jgi:acetyl esterase/lipase
MASPQLQTIIDMIRARPPRSSQEWDAQIRAEFEAVASIWPVAPDVTRTPADADGVPGEWFAAPNATDATTVLYLHGGGYSIGSINTHADLAGRISRASHARVFSINYRLAPEHLYPCAVEDATTAYRWLLKQGIDPKTIVIAGDSAGGGLTAATLLALKDAGEPLPAAAVLLSPWLDLAGTGESMKTRAAADPMIVPDPLNTMGKMYAGAEELTHPLVSPLYGDLSGLPPMLIQVGDAEVLLDDSTRFAERVKAAGVDVTLEVWDEMIHVFQFFAAMLPEGQEAIDKIGQFIRDKVAAKAAA